MTTHLTFAELDAMTHTHVCTVLGCNGFLVLVWQGRKGVEGEYQLRCGLNKAHKGHKRFRREKPVNHHTVRLSLPKRERV